MFGRKFILIAACWIVPAVPTLCMGGVLLHPCAAEILCCDVERGCEKPIGCADEREGACRHEGDCDNDPCRMFVATGDLGVRGGGRQLICIPIEIEALCPSLEAEQGLHPAGDPPKSAVWMSFAPPPLPCHESDLPLLI